MAVTSKDLVFELLASTYPGSGQTWANSAVYPVDVSAQTAYDFVLGASSSASADDPTWNAAGPRFELDGGDFFTLETTTKFLREMHKANKRYTIEIWMRWSGVVATNTAPLFDSGTSDQSGADMSRGVMYVDLGNLVGIDGRHKFRVKQNTGGGSALSIQSDNAIDADVTTMLAVSYDGTGATPSFLYKDGAYDPVGGLNTWDGALTSPSTNDAVNQPRLGARGDAAFKAPSGTRIYTVRVYARNLTKTELDANFAEGFNVAATTTAHDTTFQPYTDLTLSNSDTTFVANSSWSIGVIETAIPTTGKHFVEFTSTGGPFMAGVIVGTAPTVGEYLGQSGDAVSNGDTFRNSGTTFTTVNSTALTFTNNNVGVLVDQDAGLVRWYNGELHESRVTFTPGTPNLYFAAAHYLPRGANITALQVSNITPLGATYHPTPINYVQADLASAGVGAMTFTSGDALTAVLAAAGTAALSLEGAGPIFTRADLNSAGVSTTDLTAAATGAGVLSAPGSAAVGPVGASRAAVELAAAAAGTSSLAAGPQHRAVLAATGLASPALVYGLRIGVVMTTSAPASVTHVSGATKRVDFSMPGATLALPMAATLNSTEFATDGAATLSWLPGTRVGFELGERFVERPARTQARTAPAPIVARTDEVSIT